MTAGDACDSSPKLVLSSSSGSTFALGTTTVTATATDASGNSLSSSFTITVIRTPTATSLSLSSSTEQYSDPETLTATVTDGVTSSPVAGGTVTFKIGGSTVGASAVGAGGVATLSLALVESASLAKADLTIGNHTVTATYNGDAACYAPSSDMKTLTLAREDARVTYTGLNWAPACSSNSAVVTFSATVNDLADSHPGVISNATLSFVDRDKGTVLCTSPVGLVSSSDKTTGTAACNATLAVGDYHVGLVVSGFYTRNNPDEDDQVLEVATSCGTGIITGGGYLTLANPAGAYAGDKGSKNNFGFNVKYNKNYTNLQGTINTIIRNRGGLRLAPLSDGDVLRKGEPSGRHRPGEPDRSAERGRRAPARDDDRQVGAGQDDERGRHDRHHRLVQPVRGRRALLLQQLGRLDDGRAAAGRKRRRQPPGALIGASSYREAGPSSSAPISRRRGEDRVRVDRRPLPPVSVGSEPRDGEVEVRRLLRRVARSPDVTDEVSPRKHSSSSTSTSGRSGRR